MEHGTNSGTKRGTLVRSRSSLIKKPCDLCGQSKLIDPRDRFCRQCAVVLADMVALDRAGELS